MKNSEESLSIVGTNAAHGIDRAAAYYRKLAQEATRSEDIVSRLGSEIDTKLAALEGLLRGYDSFDTLAFMRMGASPGDLTHFRESETEVETSQSAQDVIALALLGMGLPRRPLTGENSGQPNPVAIMGLAADIVRAAQARALLRGTRAKQPLGVLAGEFLAYELGVRGRQYDSIATETNTRLHSDPTIVRIVRESLGFTLEDVRSVRDASVELLNERFFGARDRIGVAAAAGVSLEDAAVDSLRRDMNLMVNECRLFGAVSVSEVADRAGLEEAVTEAVLDFSCVPQLEPEEPANPVTRFGDGKLPPPFGCIADDGEYLLLNGFLGEDELRRAVERRLIASATRGGDAATRWSKYDKRRAIWSESEAADALSEALAGTPPRWQGQKYIGPVSPEDTAFLSKEASRADVTTKNFESDLLFVVDDVAICVEVKAASITEKARGGHASRLATDLQKTLAAGNEQADRLSRLIRANRGVWNIDGKWVDLGEVREVHSVIVMLDDMGPLSLSMNELAEKKIIETADIPWIVSLHDLRVISRTIDHPAHFLEYLRRRRGIKLATMVRGVDELDMFMWFMNGGMYFEPDPRDVAAQLPLDRPIKSAELRRFDEQPHVKLGTLTDPLDAWFYSQEGLSEAKAPKPTRRERPWVEEYLTASRSSKSPGWLRFGADLVSLSEDAQKKIEKMLNQQRRLARRSTGERSLTTHGVTAEGSWLLTLAVVPLGVGTDHLPKYMDAKQYQTQSSRSMLLLYKTNGSLYGSRYCGEIELQNAARDAEVEGAPLFSLSATFRSGPPMSQRKPKGQRAKRKKGRRRR